jgi:hypothetical protein
LELHCNQEPKIERIEVEKNYDDRCYRQDQIFLPPGSSTLQPEKPTKTSSTPNTPITNAARKTPLVQPSITTCF